MNKHHGSAISGDITNEVLHKDAPRPFLRRLVSILLPICALVFVMSLINRDQAERMPDPLPNVSPNRLQDGVQYALEQKGQEVRFWSQPVTGGSPKMLAKMDIGDHQITSSTFPNIAGGMAYWDLAEHQPTIAAGSGGAGVGTTLQREFLGVFLAPATPRKPETGETRRTYSIGTHGALRKVELVRAPLSGGPFEHIRLDTPKQTLDEIIHVVAPEGLYWVADKPGQAASITTTRYMWTEYPANGTLMFSPFGGEVRKPIASGIYANLLSAGKDFIFWISPRVYPDARHDLYCVRTADNRVSVVRDYPLTEASPLELAGRFYWGETDPKSEYRSHYDRLISSNPDGTDRRIQFSAADTGSVQIGFGEHKGRICLVLSDAHEAMPGKPKPRFWLAELNPGHAGTPRVIMQLPKNYTGAKPTFDGDYIYYYRSDTEASPIDWLFSQSTAHAVARQFRVRIPD